MAASITAIVDAWATVWVEAIDNDAAFAFLIRCVMSVAAPTSILNSVPVENEPSKIDLPPQLVLEAILSISASSASNSTPNAVLSAVSSVPFCA